MSTIILYYSNSGRTEKLAMKAQSDLECDILKIEPKVPYGGYIKGLIRFLKERKGDAPVEFVTDIPDLSRCDAVLLGYPIWGGDMPPFVADFVSRCDLDGKTVIPFATFGRSDIGGSMKTLRRVCGGAEIALPFNYGMAKKDDYEGWIQSIRGEVKSSEDE